MLSDDECAGWSICRCECFGMDANHRCRTVAVLAMFLLLSAKSADAQRVLPTLFPEQRSIQIRDPSQLPKYRINDSVPPPTVSTKVDLEPYPVSLDDVIRISLSRTDVVRILVGTTATSSGQTIYDTAITNTTIDQSNARFDPVLSANTAYNNVESPNIGAAAVPGQALLYGIRSDAYANSANLSKLNALGGTSEIGWNSTTTQFRPDIFLLNPQTSSSTTLKYTQPLLKGAGFGPNLAPIVISRINTEISFFTLKDSVQEMVRGVIEAYWMLVYARTDVWSKQQQIEQLEVVVNRIKSRVKVAFDNRADLSQVQVTLANTRAALVTSRANVIQREDALRNIIGMPPSDGKRLIPYSPPNDERFHPDWSQILEIASERRPDLVELKLIIEADQQQILLAKNAALPQLDGVALYRWNGLEGTTPSGQQLQTGTGANTDWTLGVNFSVPLGLRQSRAGLRQRELTIVRDRINLNQGMHNAAHLLATNIRTLDQNYELYLAYREVREAAKINLDYQLARYRTGSAILINVLQAVTDWGNAISNEANALAAYNTTLATLERQTGTILETHGVRFFEERFGSIGPLGRFVPDVCYPLDNRPSLNGDRYPTSDKPSEEKFELERPKNMRTKPLDIDYEKEDLPGLEESVPDVPPAPKRDSFQLPEPSTTPQFRSNDDVPIPPVPEGKKPEVETPSVSAKPKSIRQRVFGWLPR